MPLNIEDGTGIAGANSYVDAATIIAYSAARGVIIAPEGVDVIAVKAFDYIESQAYKGEQTYADGPSFPRTGVQIGQATLVSDIIPGNVKTAQCELAMHAANGVDLMPVQKSGQLIKAEKIDVIETEYFEQLFVAPVLPRVEALLKPFLNVGSGFGLKAIRV